MIDVKKREKICHILILVISTSICYKFLRSAKFSNPMIKECLYCVFRRTLSFWVCKNKMTESVDDYKT